MNSVELQAKFRHAVTIHRQGDIESAEKLYKDILSEHPARYDVLYNLALALISLDKINEAKHTLEKVLDLHPGHFDALNNLGALLLKLEQEEQALQCFSSLLAAKPDHLEARNNLAATLLKLGRDYHAAEHFRLYLEKVPDDIGARYSYGLALLDSGQLTDAIIEFEKVLYITPDHANAQSNLGIAYLKSGNTQKAKDLFQHVLNKNPHNREIKYLYSALLQENIPEKPPEEYIQHLFDHYAKHYEQHMKDVLQYNTPENLYTLFKKYASREKYSILDMGCGSGLLGLIFKPLASTLTGIDLSEKMLALAKHKNIYDELIHADLLTYLKDAAKQYDILVASDTFNYFGDLNLLFDYCHRVLNPDGFLLFSVEAQDDHPEWTLKPHGRYCHTKDYVEKIAQQHQFKIITIEESVLRVQNQEPVRGWLCLLNI